MKKKLESKPILGGMLGAFIRDLWTGKPEKEDKEERKNKNENYLTHDATEIQKIYIAQKVLTGEASSRVKNRMQEMDILDVWENRDISGYVRLVQSKIRDEIEKGGDLLNMERLLFK